MTNHRNWAFVTLAVFLVVGFVIWQKREENLSVLTVGALVVATGLLVATAYRGGDLVYKYGLGVQSLPAVSGDGHDHEHAAKIPQAQDIAMKEEGHEHASSII